MLGRWVAGLAAPSSGVGAASSEVLSLLDIEFTVQILSSSGPVSVFSYSVTTDGTPAGPAVCSFVLLLSQWGGRRQGAEKKGDPSEALPHHPAKGRRAMNITVTSLTSDARQGHAASLPQHTFFFSETKHSPAARRACVGAVTAPCVTVGPAVT